MGFGGSLPPSRFWVSAALAGLGLISEPGLVAGAAADWDVRAPFGPDLGFGVYSVFNPWLLISGVPAGRLGLDPGGSRIEGFEPPSSRRCALPLSPPGEGAAHGHCGCCARLGWVVLRLRVAAAGALPTAALCSVRASASVFNPPCLPAGRCSIRG